MPGTWSPPSSRPPCSPPPPPRRHDGHRHGGDLLRAGLAGSTKPTVIFGVQPGGRDWVVRRGDGPASGATGASG